MAKSGKFVIDPINASVSQGGFSRERGGNLRDHNGARPNEAAIAATTHYDGDYGMTGTASPPPMGMTQAADTAVDAGGGSPVASIMGGSSGSGGMGSAIAGGLGGGSSGGNFQLVGGANTQSLGGNSQSRGIIERAGRKPR